MEQMAGRLHELQQVGPHSLQQQPWSLGEQGVAAAEGQAGWKLRPLLPPRVLAGRGAQPLPSEVP